MKRGEPSTPRSPSSKTTDFKYPRLVHGHDEPSVSQQLKDYLPEELNNDLIGVPFNSALSEVAMASAKVTGAVIYARRELGTMASKIKFVDECLQTESKTLRRIVDEFDQAYKDKNNAGDQVKKAERENARWENLLMAENERKNHYKARLRDVAEFYALEERIRVMSEITGGGDVQWELETEREDLGEMLRRNPGVDVFSDDDDVSGDGN